MQRRKEKKRGKRNAEKSDEQNAKIFYHSLIILLINAAPKRKEKRKRNAEKSDEQNAKIFYHSLSQKDTLI